MTREHVAREREKKKEKKKKIRITWQLRSFVIRLTLRNLQYMSFRKRNVLSLHLMQL